MEQIANKRTIDATSFCRFYEGIAAAVVVDMLLLLLILQSLKHQQIQPYQLFAWTPLASTIVHKEVQTYFQAESELHHYSGEHDGGDEIVWTLSTVSTSVFARVSLYDWSLSATAEAEYRYNTDVL